jgi:hypothetical protein
MQSPIDLTTITDVEDRRVVVRDLFAGANVGPWTGATVHLEGGRSFKGHHPQLCWWLGEPLIDEDGDYLPDLQLLRLKVGPSHALQTSLRDVRAIELTSA